MPSPPQRAPLALAASLAGTLACGTPATPTAPATGASPAAPGDEATPGADARSLGPKATFADLVAIARSLDGHATAPASSGCLLRALPPSDAGYRLEAEVGPAVRPLPSVPHRLRRPEEARKVTLLSRWGRLGGHEGTWTWAAFTDAPPHADGPVVAVAMTSRGVQVVDGSADAKGERGPHPVPTVAAKLRARHMDAGMWVVTAEAGVPVNELYALLRRLPQDAPPVALAVPLPHDTRLPEARERADDAPSCEGGLEPPADPAAAGTLDPTAARRALQPLQDALPRCAIHDPSLAGRPARMELHVRVDRTGRVADACITEDDTGSPGVRRCVLAAVRGLTFPPPDPPGPVDLSVPVAFDLRPEPGPRPTCSD